MDRYRNPNRRLLFYTLWATYIATGMVTILSGPALPLLAAHTSVTLDIAGWIFTASSLGFTLGVLISGALSGRIPPKYHLISGLAIVGLAALVIPWTHLYTVLLLSSFILGIGFGFIDVSINMIMTLAFHDVLGEELNNLHSAFGLGALIGPLVLSLALGILHEATWAFAVGTTIAFVVIILLTPQHIPTHTTVHTAPDATPGIPAVSILAQPVLWLMALQMFLYVGAEIGFGNWITTAVSLSAAVSLVVAAPAATVYWLGLTVGRLICAQLLKRGTLSEKQLLYLSFIGGGISILIVAAFPGLIWLSFSASLLAGLFFGPIFPGVIAIASRRYVHALGTVSSVMLFSGGASGLVIPVLVGVLITHVGVGWGITLPAIISLSIAIPFFFTSQNNRSQTYAYTQDRSENMPPVNTN